jgi:hypothetical protein
VLDQPSGRHQASQRPPRADHVEVDVGAVACDDVAKVLLVSEGEDGEVEQAVALTRLGPVDDAGELVTVDEDVGDLQVVVGEHRCPRPERNLCELAVARDHAGGKDAIRDEPLALAVGADQETSMSGQKTLQHSWTQSSRMNMSLVPAPTTCRGSCSLPQKEKYGLIATV